MEGKAITICSLKELEIFANDFAQDYLSQYRKVLFYGEMGAGKTTFIKLLCKALGVEKTTASPTFALIHQYPLHDSQLVVHHADLYRLNHPEEAFDIGVEELFYDENYFFVEWPEFVEQFAPNEMLYVNIEAVDEFCRKFSISIK